MKRTLRLGLVLSALALVAGPTVGVTGAGITRPDGGTSAGGSAGVQLVYFCAVGKKATKTGRPVAVSWRTGEEANVLGFNVFRQVNTKQTKVNRTVIPAKSRPTGARYAFNDKLPKPLKTACYRLQLLQLNGAKLWLGRTCSKSSCSAGAL